MTSPRAPNSPLPDVNGLGWHGPPITKTTLSRLNASPAENATCQTRLAGAVRTVLECIGEDRILIEEVFFAPRNDMPRP
ncbi:hypothetical protein DFH94DRAFT_689463 [Russula ochroleuca]|uniref:Uncharacterized protein n=1 Tax=Russula ochroleuca TaxID=152965 RepID=A0A9P5N3N6_9AGAM|nr:hypothetical protein DFH94DRAFT_689463 [Russula ochroleuca]